MKKQINLIWLILLLFSSNVLSQTDSLDYFSLSFEELVNVKIVSASKKYENLFDASLSASVVTRDEIQRSGATSIMEALRLVPGLIVRQLTNGNYDIHIRGLDNVPPNSLKFSSISTTALVMIDNRPVYNYLQGGIFWETLPVDLNDIERIEVIRGPSSTLYGPNAVSGVVHIITRKNTEKGFSIDADAQYGSLNTTITNAAAGYRFNRKLSVLLSGNYQHRDRKGEYYDILKQQWYTTIDSLSLPNPKEYFPNPNCSMIKYGINGFVEYTPKEEIELIFSTGLQNSDVQTSNFDIVSNINTFASKSHYFQLRGSVHGLKTYLSHNTGYQWPIVGYRGGSFHFSATDASVEYELNIGNLSIKPEFSYRNAMYDDTELWDASIKEGILNGRRHLEAYAGTVRSEYRLLNERVRLAGGLRLDHFNHPGKLFLSYEAASSFKINTNNLVRAVFSKAYRSPFIYDTYQDILSMFQVGANPDIFIQMHITGNKQLDLLNSVMFELGYRSKLANNISFDIEAYTTKTGNYSALITEATQDTPENFPIVAETEMQIQNIPMWIRQTGTSVSLYLSFKNIQLKPFVTFQQTTIHDYSMWYNTSDAAPSPFNVNPAQNHINSGLGTKTDHKFTPTAYGGFYVNYRIKKFNFNVNTYYFSGHTFYHSSNLFTQNGSGIGNINPKVIANAKITYSPAKSVSVFLNVKNFLNQRAREHFQTDITPAMVLAGASIKL